MPVQCSAQAKSLVDYINSIDPYKVEKAVYEYLEESGFDRNEWLDAGYATASDYVKKNHDEDYRSWYSDVMWDLMDRGVIRPEQITPYQHGAYTTSGWFMHFTNQRFTNFEKGVLRDHIGHSGRQKEDRTIYCPNNLITTPDKALWIHAWPVIDEQQGFNQTLVLEGPRYGSSAVLFRSDCAVVGRHAVSELEHALVLGCSEYDAVAISNVKQVQDEGDDYYYTLKGTVHLNSGDHQFSTLGNLIHYLEGHTNQLSGFKRPTRWHRLARPIY